MKTKQILLCMLLACLAIPSFAQNRWGIMGGGLLSKSTVKDSYFRGGGYVGGLYDIKVSDSWYIQPQLLFTYEEFRTNKPKLVSDKDFYSKFSLDLPILASFNVRVNQNVNLRINAGPYLSYSFFGREQVKGEKLEWWHQDFGDHFTYGVKGGLSLETKHFFYNVDCKYSLDKNMFHLGGHGLTLSAGVGYKF